MVKNEQGLVAVRYLQPLPRYVVVNRRGYQFVVQHSVALAWVEEKEVPHFLAYRGGCNCGGSGGGQIFVLPDERIVQMWKTGER